MKTKKKPFRYFKITRNRVSRIIRTTFTLRQVIKRYPGAHSIIPTTAKAHREYWISTITQPSETKMTAHPRVYRVTNITIPTKYLPVYHYIRTQLTVPELRQIYPTQHHHIQVDTIQNWLLDSAMMTIRLITHIRNSKKRKK